MKKYMLLSFFICSSFFLKANFEKNLPVLEINNSIDSFLELRPYLSTYIDKTASLTFEDIKDSKLANQFVPYNSLITKWKYEKPAKDIVWLHFKVKNNSSEEIIRTHFGKIYHDSITIYLQSKNNLLHQSVGGSNTTGSQQKLRYPFYQRFEFSITLIPQQEYDFWIKVKDQNGVSTIHNPQFYNPNFYLEKDDFHYFFAFITGFYLVLIFVIIFTAVQYIQHRDKIFLFYGIYVFAILLFYVRDISVDSWYEHLVPIWFLDYRYHSLTGIFNYVSHLFFIKYFIDAKNKFPKLNKIINSIIIGFLIATIILQVIVTFDANLTWKLSYWLRGVFGIMAVFLIVYLSQFKDRSINYILIGTSLLLAGNMMTLFNHYFQWFQNTSSWNVGGIFAYVGIISELIFFSIVLGFRQMVVQQEKSKIENELLYKENEAENLKELNQLKTSFYTNITHEFRTPLTVIQGMAAELKGNKKAKDLIQNNSDQLLKLVNQLLDLSKIESGNMPMNWRQIDVINYLNYLTESLHSFAFSKKISLTFYSESKVLNMDVDPEKLQTIIINLISNALKFTPEYGKITLVGIEKEIDGKPFFILIIKDTGSGIPSEKLSNIFDRFFQVDSFGSNGNQGSGIGLAVVKELTELHQGKIEVSSIEQKGTTFTLTFPITQNAPHFNQFNIDKINLPNENWKGDNEIYNNIFTSDLNNNLPKLLVIEDNYDVIQYLTTILKEKYKITFAKNGAVGIDKALLETPDLIISDVMMPEKNGFEVCDTLKQDERTSHIPIILLTAKATIRDRIEGLQFGADAYLEKPFNKEELFIRLEKLLELRKKLQEKYSNYSFFQTSTNTTSKEELFLQKINKIIDEHLNDESFTTPFLCKKLGMSQSQLYRKLKALTGYSIANYIRYCRLQKAHSLLESSDLKINEVSYQCGFSNPSWFTQAFKEKFGYSPSELRN